MFKQYLKQAWAQLGENRLLSFISIVGTALAIAMIMAMVLVNRIEIEPFAPEINRDRTLYVTISSMLTGSGNRYNGRVDYFSVKEVFRPLTTPEVVSIGMEGTNALATIPGGELVNVNRRLVDDNFFKIIDYSFIAGAPFTHEDSEAGLHKVVITETIARTLFGTTDVVGRSMMLSMLDYTIVGVVKDVSKLATTAYGQVWIPYNGTPEFRRVENNLTGTFLVFLLAHKKSDFQAIRDEVESRRLAWNEVLKTNDCEVEYDGQPDTQETYIHRRFFKPNMNAIHLQYIIVIALLLLVPAINLSGLTLSRMRKRYPELGVRRAFGAKRSELLTQILCESLLLTLIGGVVGLLLSYGSLFVFGEILFGKLGDTSVSAAMLFDPMVFVITFLFCLLLNLLSAGIPAWRASRLDIVNALNA
jgi:putative ABC transport system permease protein